MDVRPLLLNEIDEYISHILRGFDEVARGETVAFSTYSSIEQWNPDKKRGVILAKLERPLTLPGWKRAWVFRHNNEIFGRIELGGPDSLGSLNRALLSIVVESRFRGQGVGIKLMDTAISWAKNESQLEWIDLNVFAHNVPAIHLYKKLGFVEIDRVENLLQINGASISDITMTLRVR